MIRSAHTIVIFVLLLLTFSTVSPSVRGQIAVTYSPSNPSSPVKTDHAERSLAAIDLSILAAESGIMDVSVEALKRAVGKGPPVSSVDLGGLLSAKPTASSSSSRNRQAAQEKATAKVQVAKRVMKLHDIWTKSDIDPGLAYSIWKNLVFPESRPNEAFAYSVEGPLSQSNSYSSVKFDFDQPKVADCGARALVEWATLADQLDDLKQEIAKREPLPGAANTAILLKVIIAQDESCPMVEVESLCDLLSDKPKLLVTDPNAKLLFGQVWKMLERGGTDSAAGEKLMAAILAATNRHKKWAANDWLQFLVAQRLCDSIQQGDLEGFQKVADLAMSRFDSFRSNNADWVASQESNMYGQAAKRAFKAGHIKFGTECLRLQGRIVTGRRFSNSQSNVILNPTEAVTKRLLSMDRAERYEILFNLVWKTPTLGLNQNTRLNATERIPKTFTTALLTSENQTAPSIQLVSPNSVCMSLLEWVIRDAIALGKEGDILARINALEASGSDDAKLAKLVLALAKDEPMDLSLLVKSEKEKANMLPPMFGEGSPVMALDIAVVQEALAQEEFRMAGEKLLEERLKISISRYQGSFASWLRKVKFQADLAAGEEYTTQHQLKHWVVSDHTKRTDLLAGHANESVWIQRAENTWGHEYGTRMSYFFFRYPLQGDFSISFRCKDGRYQESDTSCAGLDLEFRTGPKRVRFSGIGNRNSKSVETDAVKSKEFTSYRLTRENDSLTVQVGDDEFEQELKLISASFPFFGMGGYYYRATTFDSLKIEGIEGDVGNIVIPRSVEMLSPSLLGWSTRFVGQRLPEISFMPDSKTPTSEESKKAEHDWQCEDGIVESIQHEEADDEDDESDSSTEKDGPQKPERREALLQYLRPLCDGEQVSLEFYHEPGKYTLSPAVGRIALLLSQPEIALHWITSDPEGAWTGIDSSNRVVDENAEQLLPIKLEENDWNQIVVKLDDGVATFHLNGELVYRRQWEAEAGRKFGLFHDPANYHIKARNIQLSGNWPETLPEKLFETTSFEIQAETTQADGGEENPVE